MINEIEKLSNEELLRNCKDSWVGMKDDMKVIISEHQELFSRFEKQIPKQVVIYYKTDDVPFPLPFARCPVCEKDLFGYKSFCSYCGQAIDWSKICSALHDAQPSNRGE